MYTYWKSLYNTYADIYGEEKDIYEYGKDKKSFGKIMNTVIAVLGLCFFLVGCICLREALNWLKNFINNKVVVFAILPLAIVPIPLIFDGFHFLYVLQILFLLVVVKEIGVLFSF